jgi:hypothetical protein
MRNLFVLLACFLVLEVYGQVTYTKDIAKIIYNKCASCHRPGEIGPFSLTNYDQVKDKASTIKYVTGTKYMPPWKADPNYKHYLDENYLTNVEIKNIADWVDANMPYGDAKEEPKFPEFPTGSALGKPDLVLNFTRRYKHPGDKKDEYRYFVLPSKTLEDKVIKAIELRPGNKKIVHHALIFQDTAGTAKSFDEKTAEYGFSANTSGFDVNTVLLYDQYPGYVPGQKALRYPEGLGQRLKKGADIVIQMHYAPTSTVEYDSSSLNVFFADKNEKIQRQIRSRIMLPFDLPNGFLGFIMPANQVKTFLGKWTLDTDLSFVAIFPHMHLLGKKWKVWLERPDGSKENLIKIDDWDFNWQGGYYFNKFVIAPKGTIVYAEAIYDNTTSNANNPNNPPKLTTWGEKTSDEMYYLPILTVPYKVGDESVKFDTEVISSSTEVVGQQSKYTLDVNPNPVSTELMNVRFYLPNPATVNIALFDIKGQKVKDLRKGEFYNSGDNFVHIDAAQLSQGHYIIAMETDDVLLHTRFIKN